MKQVELVGGIVPPSVAAPSAGEGGQPTGKVGPVFVVVEVALSAPSSILVKRKGDYAARPLGRKKSKAPMSLHALRQATELGPITGHLTIVQDVPPASPVVEALAPLSPPATVVQQVSFTVVETVVPATKAESVVVPLSIVATPLLSVNIATIGAPMVPPFSSLTLVALLVAVLVTMASHSSSSHRRISLDHLYTSNDADSLWGATYKLKQKTPADFVSAFDKNLIKLVVVQNATDYAKVFLQRSLAILEENGLRHREAVQKVASIKYRKEM